MTRSDQELSSLFSRNNNLHNITAVGKEPQENPLNSAHDDSKGTKKENWKKIFPWVEKNLFLFQGSRFTPDLSKPEREVRWEKWCPPLRPSF